MKKFIEDKQQRKALRAAWSAALNVKEFKPTKDPKYGTKYGGQITVLHHYLYLALLGKNPNSMFSAPKRPKKYNRYYWIKSGVTHLSGEDTSAYAFCFRAVENIASAKARGSDYLKPNVEKFLEVFCGIVTVEDIEEICTYLTANKQ